MKMEADNTYGARLTLNTTTETNDPYLNFMNFVNLNSLCFIKLNMYATLNNRIFL